MLNRLSFAFLERGEFESIKAVNILIILTDAHMYNNACFFKRNRLKGLLSFCRNFHSFDFISSPFQNNK